MSFCGVSPVRSQRSHLAGFIVPTHPTLISKPQAGPEWFHEFKHDGYRLLALKQADRVILCSRHGGNPDRRGGALPSVDPAMV